MRDLRAVREQRRKTIETMFSARRQHKADLQRATAAAHADPAEEDAVAALRAIDDTSGSSRRGPVGRRVTFEDPDDETGVAIENSIVAADEGTSRAMRSVPSSPELLDDAWSYFPAAEAAPAPVPGSVILPPGIRRYRLEVQYRGDHFFGWDRRAPYLMGSSASGGAASSPLALGADAEDATVRSARQSVADALCVALDTSHLNVVSSVLLETGVHAQRLTCHVDVPADIVMQPRTVLQRAHAWLLSRGDPMCILSFHPAPEGFHARHSALRRVYVYRICNRIAPPLFDVGRQWHVDRALDVDAMRTVGQRVFEGTKDFAALADYKLARAIRNGGSSGEGVTMRTIEKLDVVRQEDEVLIWIVGRSFLRQQIRNMVGALNFVGQGHWGEAVLEQLMKRPHDGSPRLSVRERPPIAPAGGLALWAVEYPPQWGGSGAAFVDSGPAIPAPPVPKG